LIERFMRGQRRPLLAIFHISELLSLSMHIFSQYTRLTGENAM
jgi:hypothetical protein